MDVEAQAVFRYLLQFLPWITLIVALGVGGSLLNTWLRIKNGYPLQNSWGMAIHPNTDKEAVERVKLLTNENAQLRAEIGSIKDRLANVERIVTDDSSRLAREIDQLSVTRN